MNEGGKGVDRALLEKGVVWVGGGCDRSTGAILGRFCVTLAGPEAPPGAKGPGGPACREATSGAVPPPQGPEILFGVHGCTPIKISAGFRPRNLAAALRPLWGRVGGSGGSGGTQSPSGFLYVLGWWVGDEASRDLVERGLASEAAQPCEWAPVFAERLANRGKWRPTLAGCEPKEQRHTTGAATKRARDVEANWRDRTTAARTWWPAARKENEGPPVCVGGPFAGDVRSSHGR